VARWTTQYYNTGPGSTTAFAWADTGSDKFNREQDLYMLAQALEYHDHSVNHGKPVLSISDASVHTGAYQPSSIPNSAYMPLSITNDKIADRTIADIKLVSDPVHRDGDTMKGPLYLSLTNGGQPTWGTLYFGTGPQAPSNYLHFDGVNMNLSSGDVNARLIAIMDGFFYRRATPNTGYLLLGVQGHYIGCAPIGTGFGLVADGYPLHHDGNTVGVPLWGQVCFRAASEIPAGGRWVRETDADGRILVGAGTTSGGSGVAFAENQTFSNDGNAWKLTGHLTISGGGGAGSTGTTLVDSNPGHDFFAPAGTGNTHVSTTTHFHDFTIPGGGSAPTLGHKDDLIFPPMKSVVWARRVS